MAEKFGIATRLDNGYSICKIKCYDGYQMQISYEIFDPSGALYLSCSNYARAMSLAESL